MAEDRNSASSFRWVVEAFIIVGTLGMSALWLAPSSLLSTIMEDLSITLSQGGLLISILGLCVAVFSSVASIIIAKFGTKYALSIALAFIGSSGALVLLVNSYAALLSTRVLMGVGFAMMQAIPGVLIMQWFKDSEKPFINTINSSLLYVGMTIAFSLTLPLSYSLGSWKRAMAAYGFVILALAVLWTVIGKEKKQLGVPEEAEQKVGEEAAPVKKESPLKAAIKRKEAWLLAIALFGGMWEFQYFTTFLPTYYQTVRGLDPVTSSNITGLLTMAGVVGGVVCGFLMGIIGRRKIFTWPLHTIILFGLLGSITFEPGFLLYLSVATVGFGAAGWTPALLTIPMELKGMTPVMLGGTYALIFGLGNFAGFISPVLGGWLASIIGLRTTLFIFAFSQLLPISTTLFIPETGPKGKKAHEDKSVEA
jgi:cyanate permease